MKSRTDCNWLLRQTNLLVCMIGIGLCFGLGSVAADTDQSFSRPVVIPIRTLAEYDKAVFENAKPEPNYQVRFVQWTNTTTLKITASPQGNRSPNDVDLFVDVDKFTGGRSDANAVEHFVIVPSDYKESACFKTFNKKDRFPKFEQNTKVFDGIFFSDPFEDESCIFLPAMPDGIRLADRQADQVLYDSSTHSINLNRFSGSSHYQLSPDFPFPLTENRIGVLAFNADQTQPLIAVLEVQNSFWAVFLLGLDQPARLIIGPEETSPNVGFIPRTLSVAPDGNSWMAYVGPEAEGGRWGISVWDFGSREGETRHIGRVGSNIVAYSQHRGFDHPVVWTGRDSILFLKDDELTLSHVRITADGKTEEIGNYSFVKGQKYQTTGQLLDGIWTHEFELFRLEAVSALPLIKHKLLRVALVAVLQYSEEGVIKQTALPLVIDLPWDLHGSS